MSWQASRQHLSWRATSISSSLDEGQGPATFFFSSPLFHVLINAVFFIHIKDFSQACRTKTSQADIFQQICFSGAFILLIIKHFLPISGWNLSNIEWSDFKIHKLWIKQRSCTEVVKAVFINMFVTSHWYITINPAWPKKTKKNPKKSKSPPGFH